jgi:hypothetical protein
MAELPVSEAAISFVSAISELPASAAIMTFFEAAAIESAFSVYGYLARLNIIRRGRRYGQVIITVTVKVA